MAFLVPTLHSVLRQADEQLAAGRTARARRAYEELLERAQERPDRPMEVVARAMLARCLLLLKDLEGAREALQLAARGLDPNHLDSHGRYRGSLARLALEEGPPEVTRREMRDYLDWAEQARRGHEILDACLLLGRISPPDERVEWLQRGIEQALELEALDQLGRAYNALAAAFDALGRPEQALEAYVASRAHYERAGAGREWISASWAVGSLACRLEDWPLGRAVLEETIARAEAREDCEDLVALALADLATVYEAAGDVVEARRILIRALKRGREQQLATLWPERWDALVRYARALEVE